MVRRIGALWRKIVGVRRHGAADDVAATLERKSALLDAVMDTTDVMLAYLDREFSFVWVNHAYAGGCRMTPAELVGKNHFALYPHTDNEVIFRRVRDTGEPAFFKDKPFAFPDQPERGTTYWDWSLSPHRDGSGRTIGLVLSLRETTPYVMAQRSSRENAERMRLFIENAPAGIAMFDRQMRYLAVSKRFMEDFGIATDIVGRSHYDVFPEIPERWRAYHRRGLAGEALECEEDRFARADGRVHWGRWKIRPWHDDAGKVGGIVLFTEDITARKDTEAALVASKAEAERANEAKSRFLGSISHDLRQPIFAISLYIDTLRSRLPPGDTLLTNLKDCVGGLGAMLSNLLDLSKLDAGVVAPAVRDFDADELLAKVFAAHEPLARIKGLQLRARRFGRRGCTDPALFQRILHNLVANAVRYTNRGGVLVVPRYRDGRSWVEVWDTGIGIPHDKTDEIFEEFRQLDNDERNAEKGVGLGLAIVARTAALLGLQIRVASRVGRGSMFAVELPLTPA